MEHQTHIFVPAVHRYEQSYWSPSSNVVWWKSIPKQSRDGKLPSMTAYTNYNGENKTEHGARFADAVALSTRKTHMPNRSQNYVFAKCWHCPNTHNRESYVRNISTASILTFVPSVGLRGIIKCRVVSLYSKTKRQLERQCFREWDTEGWMLICKHSVSGEVSSGIERSVILGNTYLSSCHPTRSLSHAWTCLTTNQNEFEKL